MFGRSLRHLQFGSLSPAGIFQVKLRKYRFEKSSQLASLAYEKLFAYRLYWGDPGGGFSPTCSIAIRRRRL